MADTIFLKDGTMEVILDDEAKVLERLIRDKLGNEAADRCSVLFQTITDDYETDMIIDEYCDVLRHIQEWVTSLRVSLEAKRLDRKDLSYKISKIQDILDKNL